MIDENNNPATGSSNNTSVKVEGEFTENEHKNLRAFFVSFAANPEEARAVAEGKMNASGFIPLYAESEQAAFAFLNEQAKSGLTIVGFEPLEVLEMKTFMLRNIAEKNGINIQRQKMFDGRLLLLESNPVQIYDYKKTDENVSGNQEENPQG